MARKLRELSSVYARPSIVAALSFWLLWCGFHTAEKVIDYYTPLPMWDYWRVVDHLNDYRSFHLAVFWRQHNEHRIVFPEIAFALDMLLMHGRMLLPIALSGLSYLGTWLVLCSSFWSEASMSPFIRLVAVLISGVVAFWQGVAGVLSTPFLLNWTLMQVAAAIALVSASRLRSLHPGRHFAATIIASIVASYSSGNGLFLWPFVIAVAIAFGARRRLVLALSATAILATGVYFIGYRLPEHSNMRSLISSPLYFVEYVASYLSMPFGAMKSPIFGVKLGFALCIAVLGLFVIAWFTRRLIARPSVVLFGYVSLTFLTAVLTAGGRMDANDPRFTAAHAFRYVSVAQMNWSASILLAFSVLSGAVTLRKYLPFLAAAMVVALWIAFPKLSPWLGNVASYLTEQQVATLSLESGLHDARWMEAKVFPSVELLDRLLVRLREQKLSIYYNGWNRYLGRPLASVASVHPEERMPGMVVDAIPVESGFQLRGWADRSGRRLPPLSLVFADESGAIVGFGRQFPGGLPPVLASPRIPSSLAWVGFVSGQTAQKLISAYVRAPQGNAVYPLGQPINLP